jgi:o-succinylbenzoate synthase
VSWRRARLQPFALPLERTLLRARDRLTSRSGWLLRLEAEAGVAGLATAMPIGGFGGEDFEACGAALVRALDREAAGRDPASRTDDGVASVQADGAAPFAHSALELARLDLEARGTGRSLASALGCPDAASMACVPVNALMGGDDVDELRAQVRALRAYDVIKLKVGADVDRALVCIDAACAELTTGQRLRIDPNQSWSTAAARRALAALAQYPIDYVEQPVASPVAMAELRRLSPLALAADESACDADGLREVIAREAADVIVLKPMRAGGPREALALAQEARTAGLDVVVTSLLDSALGVRAALAVALALGPPLRACGLETSALFAADLVPAPVSREGVLCGWSEPGLGASIDEAVLRSLALGPERRWSR